MGGFDGISERFWRSLLSVVVAYAVAIQSLLIAVAGFSLPADGGQNAPAFELCLHDAAGEPALPASNPDQSGCTHCIFCFAGAHHAVIGTAPAVFHTCRCRDGGRGVARRHVRLNAANPLHDRKSKRSSAQRVTTRGD